MSARAAPSGNTAAVYLISLSQSFTQPLFHPAPRIFPFGENDQPAIVPSPPDNMFSFIHCQPLHPRVGLENNMLGECHHFIDCSQLLP
jgi:hypothetical protein